MVLHALEGDDPVAGSLDDLLEHPEPAQAQFRQLPLDEQLRAVLQAFLYLADADREHARLAVAVAKQKLGEELRLSRASPAPGALVAGRGDQSLEHAGRLVR